MAALSLNQSFKEESVFYRQRLYLLDLAAPLSFLSQKISDKVGEIQESFRSYKTLQAEVELLRRQKETLLKWQHHARLLQQENSTLRQQLRVLPDPAFEEMTVRVVGRPQSAYNDFFIISGNAKQGIEKDSVVMTLAGVVGRTQEMGAFTTRVLPLTNLNSRIPVTIFLNKDAATEKTQTIQGIAVGDGQGGLLLNYVSEPQMLRVGDPLYTSGVGGIFPPRLPVGVISKIQGDRISVIPYFQEEGVEFMRVLHSKAPATGEEKGGA